MTTGKTIALTRWAFVCKVMSLLFNMLSSLVIAFLPRLEHLLISWLQAPSAENLQRSPTVVLWSHIHMESAAHLPLVTLALLTRQTLSPSSKPDEPQGQTPSVSWGPACLLSHQCGLSTGNSKACPAPLPSRWVWAATCGPGLSLPPVSSPLSGPMPGLKKVPLSFPPLFSLEMTFESQNAQFSSLPFPLALQQSEK